MFWRTWCVDEFFMQTLIVNSPWKEKLYYKEFDMDKDEDVVYAVRKTILSNKEDYIYRK